jgi:hypothetical protein
LNFLIAERWNDKLAQLLEGSYIKRFIITNLAYRGRTVAVRLKDTIGNVNDRFPSCLSRLLW